MSVNGRQAKTRLTAVSPCEPAQMIKQVPTTGKSASQPGKGIESVIPKAA